MNPQDGWVNFADYLELNKDASQRQLQGALDSRKGDAEQIRANADRNYARAGQAGFEGNTAIALPHEKLRAALKKYNRLEAP